MLAVSGRSGLAQSGTAGSRPSGRDYGVNLTYAVYLYNPATSASVADVVRLTSTFSSAKEEMAHLREKNYLHDIEVRHIRSVGLRGGETFDDAVRLGDQYLDLSLGLAKGRARVSEAGRESVLKERPDARR